MYYYILKEKDLCIYNGILKSKGKGKIKGNFFFIENIRE